MPTPRPAALTGSRTRRGAQLMWRGMRAHPGVYLAAVGTSAVFGAMTVGVSRVLGTVTDRVVVPALAGDEVARGRVWLAGGAVALVAVTLAASVAARRIFAGMGYADIQADHRRGVTRQYLRLPLSWHRRHPTGQLLSNASADVEAATGVFNPLPFALGVVVMILVATVMLVRMDPALAVAALAVLPLAVLANLVFQRRMTPHVTRAQELRARVADQAHESFEASVLVTSLGTADREEARFTATARQLRDTNVRVGIVRAVFDPVIDLLPGLGTLGVLLVGTLRARSGHVTTGDVVTAAYLLQLMAVPVRAFGWVLGELPRGLVGYERIARVLDADGVPTPGRTAWSPGPEGARVTLRGVHLTVSAVPAPVELLRGVELEVSAGRTVAIVGATGSGKTTLVGLVARLQDPTGGAVLLDGVDVREIAPADLAAHVAFVSQTTFVFEDTVRGNVTLCDEDDPAAPSDDEVWAALRRARVDEVVAALPGGLSAPLGERGANLSGGQRQRLALARALVRRPAVLVLDDATSAVDPRVEREVLQHLRQESGATVLLVAYRMSSVLLADEVVHVEAGRVVDRGTHAQLLARDPGYAELATAYEQQAARRERERAARDQERDLDQELDEEVAR